MSRPHLSCTCGWGCVGDQAWVNQCSEIHAVHCARWRDANLAAIDLFAGLFGHLYRQDEGAP